MSKMDLLGAGHSCGENQESKRWRQKWAKHFEAKQIAETQIRIYIEMRWELFSNWWAGDSDLFRREHDARLFRAIGATA